MDNEFEYVQVLNFGLEEEEDDDAEPGITDPSEPMHIEPADSETIELAPRHDVQHLGGEYEDGPDPQIFFNGVVQDDAGASSDSEASSSSSSDIEDAPDLEEVRHGHEHVPSHDAIALHALFERGNFRGAQQTAVLDFLHAHNEEHGVPSEAPRSLYKLKKVRGFFFFFFFLQARNRLTQFRYIGFTPSKSIAATYL
jgi:hypothetical protein